MKSSNKLTFAKSSLAIFAIAIATVNFSSANSIYSISKVKDAQADVDCTSKANAQCFLYEDDNGKHYQSNSEND